MGKHSITIEFDLELLHSYTDDYVAQLWHIAQANPAPFGDKEACDLAASIGFEIIRRWLKGAPVELYNHQENHRYSALRTKHNEYRAETGRKVVDLVQAIEKLTETLPDPPTEICDALDNALAAAKTNTFGFFLCPDCNQEKPDGPFGKLRCDECFEKLSISTLGTAQRREEEL